MEVKSRKKRKLESEENEEPLSSSSIEFSSPEAVPVTTSTVKGTKYKVGKYAYAISNYSKDQVPWIGKILRIFQSGNFYKFELHWFFRRNELKNIKLEYPHEIIQTNRSELVAEESMQGSCKVN